MTAGVAIAAVPADAAVPVRFSCAVEGAQLVKGMTSAMICSRFKAGVDKALGRPSTAVDKAPDVARDKSDWVRIEVRITKPGVATARLVRAQGGKITTHPDFSVAVSDRAVGQGDIAMLVDDVVRQGF